MHVLVVGLGSIGRQHLATIRALEPHAEITVLRHARTDAAIPPGAQHLVYTLDDAIALGPDVGFVCGPTTTHVRVGVELSRAGVHLFVEKPLALDTVGAQQLLDAAIESGRILVVGYNLRFSDSLRALHAAAHDGRIGRIMSGRAEVGQYLPDWRPSVEYRTTNSARQDSGGGVIFELSHEIDYMLWLIGEIASIDAVAGRLSDLDIDVDDTAELLLSFTNGSIGNIHMDMTQHSAIRRCRLVGVNGTLTWDGIAGETCLYKPRDGWTTLVPAGSQDRNAMYRAEIAHFFACVRGEAVPLVDGRAGARVVEVAQAAQRAAREQRRIAV